MGKSQSSLTPAFIQFLLSIPSYPRFLPLIYLKILMPETENEFWRLLIKTSKMSVMYLSIFVNCLKCSRAGVCIEIGDDV